MKRLKKIIEDPLDDSEIRKYLPNAKIMTYDSLGKYTDIEQLLPQGRDYCILLYRQQPTFGHWVSIDRIGDNISYFDSYGGEVDNPLKWNTIEINNQLGQSIPYLSKLFDNTDKNIYYNPFRYQSKSNDTNTCGRWCILRCLFALKGYNLEKFYNQMKELRDFDEMNYDELVSSIISIH